MEQQQYTVLITVWYGDEREEVLELAHSTSLVSMRRLARLISDNASPEVTSVSVLQDAQDVFSWNAPVQNESGQPSTASLSDSDPDCVTQRVH